MRKAFAIILCFLLFLTTLSGCNAKSSTYEVKSKEEIFTKTVHDFGNLRVENLDDQEHTNFLVYGEDVKEITVTKDANILVATNYEQLSYTFANADESLKNLKRGDVLFARATAENPECLVAKVKRIEIQENLLIVYSSEVSLADLFVYADVLTDVSLSEIVDTSLSSSSSGSSTSNATAAASQSDNAQSTTPNSLSVSTNWTVSHNISIQREENHNSMQITGESYTSLKSVTLEFRFSREHMQLFTSISGDFETGSKASFALSSDLLDYSKTIAQTYVPYGVFGLKFELIGHLNVSGSTTGGVTHKQAQRVGFSISVSPQSFDAKPINETIMVPNVEGELGKAEGSFGLGLELKPSLRFGFIGSIYGSAHLGVEATASATLLNASTLDDQPDAIHACNMCVDGDLNDFLHISCGLEFNFGLPAKNKDAINKQIQSKLEKEEEQTETLKPEFTLFSLNEKMGDFYLSFTDESPKFGWGECQNYRYRTLVAVEDESSQPVANTEVAVISEDIQIDTVTSDAEGQAAVYLPNGTYNLEVNNNTHVGSTSVQIDNTPTEVTLMVDGIEYVYERPKELHIIFGCTYQYTHNPYTNARDAFGVLYDRIMQTCGTTFVENYQNRLWYTNLKQDGSGDVEEGVFHGVPEPGDYVLLLQHDIAPYGTHFYSVGLYISTEGSIYFGQGVPDWLGYPSTVSPPLYYNYDSAEELANDLIPFLEQWVASAQSQ